MYFLVFWGVDDRMHFSFQLERKRHIGNDICCIVFQETSSDNFKPTFSPTGISSHFLRKSSPMIMFWFTVSDIPPPFF